MDLTLPLVLSLSLLGPVEPSADLAHRTARMPSDGAAAKRVMPRRLGNATYAREAADQVLATADREGLMDHLDILAGDQDLWDDLGRQAVEMNPPSLDVLVQKILETPTLDMPSLRRVLGEAAAERCQEGWVAFQAATRRCKEQITSPITTMPPHIAVTDMAYDPSLPPTLRHFIARALQVQAAVIVIARAEEVGQKLEPSLAMGLANAWAEGPESLDAALANPESSQDRGRDYDPMVEQALLKQWVEAANASGEGIFFPFARSGAHEDGGV